MRLRFGAQRTQSFEEQAADGATLLDRGTIVHQIQNSE
jgi:hypothetical protein